MNKIPLIIIGGGLSGLYLAYRLAQEGKVFLLLEARNRLGGRIKTSSAHDLGPTWFWPGQQHMMKLTQELDLQIFEQQNADVIGDILYEDPNTLSQRLPGNQYQMTSYRIQGGISSLIDKLEALLPSSNILLNHKVTSVENQADAIKITTQDNDIVRNFICENVIFALPPRLIESTIQFVPNLNDRIRKDMRAIPTWMAGHAKALIRFQRPFWKDYNLSGQAFSRIGPMMEIHDASSPDQNYALFGFLGGSGLQRKNVGKAQLKRLIEEQIQRLFGPEAPTPLEIIIKDWSQDPLTATEKDLEPLQTHPRYRHPESMKNIWQGQMRFIGSELASSEGGYLEGALIAAAETMEEIS
ncbi:flavin monoamine oxidase family protein [Kiloniella majae]|uniref:flavin monoamine oxidase family protein n=1 Tax=Kiloniella majae TaxID=1938558 RepID=UPI000A279142|nr:FAD-dependent oxidoreductase [Kiloniella majae]